MNLTDKPDQHSWPSSHYVFVEKIGPFQETAAKAWEELHQKTNEVAKQTEIRTYTSLYKVRPEMVYRAGFMTADKPKEVPAGMKYEYFQGGDYLRFTLVGPYSQLPEASGKVFDYVKANKVVPGENFFIENYVNSPQENPPEKLITEIMVPLK